MRLLLLMILVVPGLVTAQTDEEGDVWDPLRFLIGEWEGAGAGGRSTVEARYAFVLGENYIEAWHKAVFAPDEKNPEGEVHEDRGFISYDRDRETFIYRQFHVEGFVNQYVLDSLTSDGKTLVFLSEAVENAPPGTRAKEVFTLTSGGELKTEFHVAWPNKEFQCYSQNDLKRRR